MKTSIPVTLLKLALCTAACFSPAAQTSTLNHGFEDCRVATADELDEMRGGFDYNFNVGPLHITFSIDQVTFINGTLVAATSMNILSLNTIQNILSLNSLGNPQAFIASLLNAVGSSYNPVNAVQNAPQNISTLPAVPNLSTTAPTTVTQNAAGSSVNPVAAIQNGPQNTSTLPDAPNLPTTAPPTTVVQNTSGSSYSPVNAVQNGTKNTFTLPDGFNLSTTALNTVIQNTVDNQVIRSMTILNATLNSQSLIRAMAISSSINQMLNSSVR